MKELDISNEVYREYQQPDGSVYRIENPKTLFLKDKATGHRVLDKQGITHWIPVGPSTCIRWSSPDKPVNF